MIQITRSYLSILMSAILMAFIAPDLAAQASFAAQVSNEKIYKGSFFKIEFQLSNARGSRFAAPKFDKFKVSAGPARSYQTSVVNGKASSFESYSYTLQALEIGEYILPPATIVVKGKKIQSNTLKLKVLAPLKEKDLLSNGAPSGDAYFLVCELSEDTAVVGQQIILDYRIFTKKNIDKIDFKSLPDLSNFHWESVQLINEPANQVEISGDQYTTKLLKRYILFPKQSGNFDIHPAQLLLMFPKPRKRGFFFDNYETKYINSNGLSLLVNPLPTNKPANFTGLVGRYTMTANSRREKLTTDDALTVHMRITGDGDANRMSLKPIPTSNGLERYDPKIISKNNDKKTQSHFAVIEYLYTTSKPGRYFIQPEFSYFDVDSNRFMTLKSDSFLFNVQKGHGLHQSETIDTSIVYELVEARTSKPTVLNTRFPWIKWMWLVFLITAIGLSLAKWKALRNAAIVQKKTKKQLALEQLNTLRDQKDDIAHRIEEILGDYFRYKLEISETEWSPSSLKNKLDEINYEPTKAAAILTLLEQCKFAAYGGQQAAQKVSWIQEAISIIENY